jgi:ATP-dependent DNA helicase RecQ
MIPPGFARITAFGELMIQRARNILKAVFGYDEFISLQQNVIKNVLAGKDTLAVMPTGGGKSLCYQVPALLFDGITIVISPLISLMKDQVQQLSEAGVPAVLLNSSIPSHAYRQNVEKLKRGEAKLLYVAPETLLKPVTLELLRTIRVSCLAIDEAHCISEWGSDFRPEYRQLARVREQFPESVCIALTATATKKVRADIIGCLGFSGSGEFVAGFNRENLFIRVKRKANPLRQTRDFLGRFQAESGIIYCLARKTVDEVCAALISDGLPAVPYHAGLTELEREGNQDRFVRDEARIIVATIAFGMGINKSNIRFVLHYDLPKSIENYYQEIGRAGRDGMRAECLLLFSPGDIGKMKPFINGKEGPEKRAAWFQLQAMLRFAESDVCRRIPLLGYFGETWSGEGCAMCDICLAGDREKKDLTIPAQKFLSCVKRTGEKFGANHVIDVLRGSKSAKVFKFGHEKLSTYGIGMEYSRIQWHQLARQLIHRDCLIQDMNLGSLKLAPVAWEILRGRQSFLGVLHSDAEIQAETEEHPVALHDGELFELLRIKRRELASAAELPPYVIFSDKTLVDMSTYFPQSPEGMLQVYGMGTAKLEKYGAVFISLIRAYCEPRGKEERKRPPSASKKKNRENVRSIRQDLIAHSFNSGRTVESLSEELHIKQERVLYYLWRHVESGGSLRAEGLISLVTVEKLWMEMATKAFAIFGTDRLKPVFEYMDGNISYDQLRIIGLYQRALLPPDGVERAEPQIWPKPRMIVCLASSRKFSGRCIAGKALLPDGLGGWIRLVSGSETGELSMKEITMRDGNLPEPLDIFAVHTGEGASHSYQSENVLAGDLLWIRRGKITPTLLGRLCDDPEHLWINGFSSLSGSNDRIPLSLAQQGLPSSLLFIPVERLCMILATNARGLKRILAEFTYHAVEYRLAVTDPAIEEKYMGMDIGRYPVENAKNYVTVSIGEPFNDFCYKLAAAIISLPASAGEFSDG